MNESQKFILADESVDMLQSGIISTLLYFDIFSYPLNKQELKNFCPLPIVSEAAFGEALQSLTERKLIKYSKGFYLVNNDFTIIDRRIKGNFLAEDYRSLAKKYSGIISKFPFVKAVFISGSLSKGYMDKDSDIDFFIITEKGKLWLCRMLLVIFKKIFLLNSHKYFCINYFIDESSLEIPDKNIYSATELRTLLPMYNVDLYHRFLEKNSWASELLPNDSVKKSFKVKPHRSAAIKRFFEGVLRLNVFRKLDDYCLKITLNYWKKKFNHFSEEDFKHALRSKKNVSKHHPNKFQEKVLKLHKEKLALFEKKYELSFEYLNGLSKSFFQ